jgi:hypothetical protein
MIVVRWDFGKRKIWFSSPGCSGNAAAKTATNTNLRGFKNLEGLKLLKTSRRFDF